MTMQPRRSLRQRLVDAYFALVGAVGGGIGAPIVDRRRMYGDDPANDPFSREFDAGRSRR
jgi:hypothetical protein